MKRLGLILMCLLVTVAVFATESTGPNLVERVMGIDTLDPRFGEYFFTEVEAMGGATTAIANGYEALFTNPAGFSRRGGELVFTSFNMYSDLIPDQAVLEKIAMSEDLEDLIDSYVNDDAFYADMVRLGIEDEGIGTVMNFGAGWSAFGLGVGTVSELTMLFLGEPAVNADPIIDGFFLLENEISVGLSHQFDLGIAALNVGGNIKGLNVNYAMIDDMLNKADDPTYDAGVEGLTMGLGYGFDAGAILDIAGGLSVGVVVENIGGMEMYWLNSNIGDFEDYYVDHPENLIDDILNSDTIDTYEMTAKVGVGYETPRGRAIGLRLAADYELDLETLMAEDRRIAAEEEESSIGIDQLQLGAEVTFLGLAKARAGLNKGQIMLGAGLDLLLFEVNATYYSDYLDSDDVTVQVIDETSYEQLVIGAKLKL